MQVASGVVDAIFLPNPLPIATGRTVNLIEAQMQTGTEIGRRVLRVVYPT
jgi:hypothetical protein